MEIIRKCIVTGKKMPRTQLYKIVKIDGEIMIDEKYEFYQKSTYITKNEEDLIDFSNCKKKKIFGKSNFKKTEIENIITKVIK